jgi:hypothetical protein
MHRPVIGRQATAAASATWRDAPARRGQALSEPWPSRGGVASQYPRGRADHRSPRTVRRKVHRPAVARALGHGARLVRQRACCQRARRDSTAGVLLATAQAASMPPAAASSDPASRHFLRHRGRRRCTRAAATISLGVPTTRPVARATTAKVIPLSSAFGQGGHSNRCSSPTVMERRSDTAAPTYTLGATARCRKPRRLASP